ncbi:MAG TPA: class I tRNA ligase family protein [Phycisphaerales bacterium]|nr:class I tRNA ligase family protein [Phycisphaerales bacterium]
MSSTAPDITPTPPLPKPDAMKSSQKSGNSSPSELPKSYVPADWEQSIRARWDQAKAFHADPDRVAQSGGKIKPFCILIPPPNVTAALHLGHAFNNTLQDILVRYHRMLGDETLWMPGTDHAGITTQTVVDKRLQTQGQPSLKDYKKLDDAGQNGREQFVEKVQAWKDEYEATIIQQLKLMGCSCDFDRTRFTMDEVCAKAVREAFFRLFKDGLIYRGKRLVNWDPVSQTALADDEVEMEEVHGHMYYLRYPIASESSPLGRGQGEGRTAATAEYVVVATTRPETMLGDTAVAVNPKDPRAAQFVGKNIRLPIVGRIIPIIADDYVVRPVQFGGDESDAKAKIATGFLKVTPAHDDNDYLIGQRHNLQTVNIFAPDATISDKHGWTDISDEARQFLGLSREDARKKIVAWFKANNLLEDIKPYTHSVGHSYRTHVPIEPYLSDQWYVKVTDDRMRGSALRAMARSSPSGGTAVPAVAPQNSGPIVADTLAIHQRKLPHWQVGGSTYFVTFRLGQGSLSESERQIVLNSAVHWHGERAVVYLVTVMPDHVHLLIKPLEKTAGHWHSLPDILHRIKSFSAHEILKQRGAEGHLWQSEYFDRVIRDEEEFLEKWNYIWNNPVKAGLAREPDQYLFTKQLSDDDRDGRPTKTKEGDGSLHFFPERYAKTFQTWHENLRDWCISRQIWWGHRIPVWSGARGDTQWLERWEISGDAVVHIDADGDADDSSYSDSITIWVCVRHGCDELENQLNQRGFKRDPDVLDTWFSSALWPISTMGWPDPSAFPRDIPEGEALLNTFNPSTVLFTAREIMTLWVSRMVMFNRYFRDGKLPFEHVYIHAMIQDGHGQKMSKSLGNGVDPRDIIHSHGADAMRFIMAQIATATQDVRLPVDMMCPHPDCGHSFMPKFITTSAGYKVADAIQECPKCKRKMVSGYGAATGIATPTADMPLARNSSAKFDEGRNFANKLYQATNFARTNLKQNPVTTSAIDANDLSLVDRWIISRLHKTLHAVEDALKDYQFKAYADAMYDFVWNDFCSWYLEAVKPTIKSSPSQQQVLRTVLNAILRLLHPIMPFITEALWPSIQATGPAGLPGIHLPDSDLLARAAWPDIKCSVHNSDAVAEFERVQTLINAVRQRRSESNIPDRQDIQVHAAGSTLELMQRSQAVVEAMTRSKASARTGTDRPPGSAIVMFEGDEILLTGLQGHVDSATEKQRLAKVIAEKERAVSGFSAKLSNAGYVSKAPADKVQETRDMLAKAQADLDAARSALAALQ